MGHSIAVACRDFGGYLKRNKAILLSFVFAFACYGFMLTHYSLKIDEETWIKNTDPSLINLWLKQGRFGLYVFDLIFTPLGRYIPLLWDALAIILWTFAGILFSFCISIFSQRFSRFSVFAFCAVFASVPFVVGEVISFSMFNMQQALAMVLMALSVCFLFIYFQYRHKGLPVISALLLFAAASFYQAFPAVFISATVIYGLLMILKDPALKLRPLMMDILRAAAVFISGVGLYYIANLIITTYAAPGGEGYFSSAYIGWNNGSGVIVPLLRTAKRSLYVLAGQDIVGGLSMLLTTGLFIVCAAASLRQAAARRVLMLVFLLLMLLSMFSLQFVFAMPNIVGRTYLAVPLVCAMIVFLVLNAVRLKWAKALSAVIVCFMLAFNVYSLNLYFYESHQSYIKDKQFAQSLSDGIDAQGYNGSGKAIVLIGQYRPETQIPDYGPATGSFFNWDGGNIRRMVDFLQAEGYSLQYPSKEQIVGGLKRSEAMPPWPEEGSIAQTKDSIVIKLSPVSPQWYVINGIEEPDS